MKCMPLIVAGIAAAALMAAGCGKEPEPKPAAPVQAPAKAAAQPSAPENIEILSVLSVEQEVDVLAQRSGTVVELAADQSAQMAKGALLARLDDRDLAAQVDRARADLAAAESNVKYNEAELKARQAAFRRAQEMRRSGLNSDADLEEADFRAQGAQHDLEGWKAIVDRNRAGIRVLELELERTRIRAPFAGVVARRYIRMGQDVLKDEKCFRFSQLTPLLVRFPVPETAVRRAQAGAEVKIAVGSDGKQTYAARIERVSPTVDPASGSYEVTAALTGPGREALRPGMAVKVLWPNK